MEKPTDTKEAHNGLSVLLLAFRRPCLRWSRRLCLTVRIRMLLPHGSAQDSLGTEWGMPGVYIMMRYKEQARSHFLLSFPIQELSECSYCQNKKSRSIISQVSKMFLRYTWVTRRSRTKSSVKSCYSGLIMTKSYDSMMQPDLGYIIWFCAVLVF